MLHVSARVRDQSGHLNSRSASPFIRLDNQEKSAWRQPSLLFQIIDINDNVDILIFYTLVRQSEEKIENYKYPSVIIQGEFTFIIST